MPEPVPQEELPILEALVNIRNRLTALKKDRGEFIKASDVNSLYQAVVKQVQKLNAVRDDNTVYNNRVDTTLADVFTLLSLFYLTIGKTREAPATYSQIASMRQILDHLNESSIYNEEDLAPFQKRLAGLRHIVQQDAEQGKHPKALTTLLERQLNECDAVVNQMLESLSVISPELIPVHEKLVTIRRQLVALAAKEGSHKAELKPIQEELRKIDSLSTSSISLIPKSQAVCTSLLEECFEIAQEIKAHDDSKNVASSLKPIYDRLRDLRAELESMVLTHRWSLRETDLWNYSLSLQEIDKMRVDGKFVDSEGNRPAGQYVSLNILKMLRPHLPTPILQRTCLRGVDADRGVLSRAACFRKLTGNLQQANKLNTVKRCLNEVLKCGGPFNARDLYPYQLALFQIDSMRKEGRFVSVDGTIPEGQGIIMANLNECHELVEMLKESMDEGETEEDEEDYDYDGSDDD
ncbi:hypothetical protein CC1G_00989 [Coprinopsis cinerea okayama7|uniref:Uncharacterized protein n=1 Tax=Coprinopsis cinerea (strain Okayama-7 / 130 / ATCC MYA-4618 / FGSC 9003) TaxID=240176 RepID=A8N9B4_COPC7|nr:hypothetical protein CC1G_00989 [Coprinopsis cinerea okayama7\|eukprot:XP_001831442.2 hypothetical protein CC1G_00989 [Coprinopsis cinerea okayama7\